MTNDIATLRSMRNNLQQYRNSTPRSTGGTAGYLKFSKGDWSFGRDETPLDLEGFYVMHPQSLMHGWICWRAGAIFGKEVLIPFTQPLPLESSLPPAPEPAPDSDDQPGYQHQMAFQVVGIEGKQTGQQFTFKTGTVGGRAAVDKVVEALMARMDDVDALGEGGIYPVLEFGVDSYKHKTRGKIFVPVIKVVGWSTNEPDEEIDWVDEADEAEEVKEVAPPPPAAARRRRVAG